MNNFAVTVPSNVWMTNLTLGSAGAAPDCRCGRRRTAPGAGTTPATGLVGTVSVNGVAMDHPDVATWLDTLAASRACPTPTSRARRSPRSVTRPVVNFVSTATITDEALSHRYDRKQG